MRSRLKCCSFMGRLQTRTRSRAGSRVFLWRTTADGGHLMWCRISPGKAFYFPVLYPEPRTRICTTRDQRPLRVSYLIMCLSSGLGGFIFSLKFTHTVIHSHPRCTSLASLSLPLQSLSHPLLHPRLSPFLQPHRQQPSKLFHTPRGALKDQQPFSVSSFSFSFFFFEACTVRRLCEGLLPLPQL